MPTLTNAHAMDCDSGAGPDAHTISYLPQPVLKPRPYSEEEINRFIADKHLYDLICHRLIRHDC
jgi:hypothetical protein